jgi:Fe-S cluster assembly protein SufD
MSATSTTSPARAAAAPAAIQAFMDAWSDIGPGTDAAAEIRSAGMAAFEAAGLPTVRDEAWKYTSLRTLGRQAFRTAGPIPAPGEVELDAATVAGLEGPRIVFLNGRLLPELSTLGEIDGITISSLNGTLADPAGGSAGFAGKLAHATNRPFAALNQAFLGQGVLVEAAAGAAPATPLYLQFYFTSGPEPVAAQPRVLVRTAPNSRLTMVEHFVGEGEARNLTNAVTEIELDDGSHVEHYRLQEETPKCFHVGGLYAHVGRDAALVSHNLQLGAAIGRMDIDIALRQPGAAVTLNGLYFVDGRRHIDNHTRVDHFAPHTSSEENYCGIVDGRGRAVFNGKAVVHQDAQKIEAHQSNRNLLLSEQAEVDTKPELEIYADDVKCSHGATVGQLDADALFYLLSRGIDRPVAQGLLTFAFAETVASRIGLAPIRRRLETGIAQAIPDAHLITETLEIAP